MKPTTLLILATSTSFSLAGRPENPCNPQRSAKAEKSNRNNIDAILAAQDGRTNQDFIQPVGRVQIPAIPTDEYIKIHGIASSGPPDLSRWPEDKSTYSLFNPTPNHLLRDLSPDRPDATESPLTVDAGRFALEASLLDYRRDKGAETFTYGQLNFKAGLTKNTDLQTVIDLYSDTPDGYGFGDVTFRLKWNLYGNDHGDSALALMPFVKIPTDTQLSNNQWEGGLIIPWGTSLTDTIGLGLMAEFDYVFNEDTGRHEFEILHTAVIGFDLTEKTGAYVEYIGIAGEHDYQAYLVGGMSYTVNENLILDFGAQTGLNSDSEDFGFFTGFTKRF